MKEKRYPLLLIVCLLTLLGAFLLGGKSIWHGGSSAAAPEPTPSDLYYAERNGMPPELMYGVLFEEIAALKQKDTEMQQQSVTTGFKSSFYQNRLGLQAAQFTTVDNAANSCATNLQPVEQRIQELVNQYRAQYPNGKLRIIQPTPNPEGGTMAGRLPRIEPLSSPPAELDQLQAQRKQIILQTKDNIRQSLGDTEFAKFDAAVFKNATHILTPVATGSDLPRNYPTPTPGN